MVGWNALGVAAIVAALLAAHGLNEAGVRAAVRATARTSFLLFLAAFSASALHRLFPGRATRFLLKNRRYLGVSFAASHAFHFGGLAALASIVGDRFWKENPAPIVIGGGLGFAFIFAMAATSFDSTAAFIGPRRWRLLHTAGVHYLWAIFTFDYVGMTLAKSPAYAPLALLAAIAMALRIGARLRAPSPAPERAD